MHRPLTLLILGVLLSVSSVRGQSTALVASHLDGISWRSVGPAAMGGRITDLAVRKDKPAVFFFGAATGGVWRTTNGGTTFEPVFDTYGTGSIGAVALAPSDPDIVWVGSGEANARNSASYGDGVYKSTDGGDSWKHMGLRETRHVGSISVHPVDPDVVFVAGLGHVWGSNPMRGLYRTNDGGETWSQVLAIDDDTGCIDVTFHPTDSKVVYCAAYQVRRDGFDTNDPAVKYGERAGIYRSTDGGTTWGKLTSGLPTCKYGRVGLETCTARPNWVFAVVETEYTGRPAPTSPDVKGGPAYLGVRAEDRDGNDGALVLEVLASTGAKKAGIKRNDILLEIGGKKVVGYDSMIEAIGAHKAGDRTRVVVKRGDKNEELDLTFGPRQAPRIPGTLGGQGANSVEKQGPTGFQTGGVYLSKNRGEKWERINSLTPRPFYYSQIRVDPTNPENIWVLGTQLHVSRNGGKRFRPTGARGIHVDHHAMWIDPKDPRHMLLGNDGGLHVTWDRGGSWETLHLMPLAQFYGIALDDRKPYRIYGGLQDNGSWGFPSRVRSTYGITNEHVFRIGSGDGFLCAVDPSNNDIVYCESQGGNLRRVNVATGATSSVRRPGQTGARRGFGGGRGARGRSGYRFNWETPFLLSPHNPRTLLWAGNKVFRSINRGDSAKEISKDITASSRGTASALAESPRAEGVIWVGTDDGALHVTRNGGKEWTAVHDNLPTLKTSKWISHIECSRGDAGTAWIVIDGHRSHDFRPHIWKTSDYGKTFERMVEGMPVVSTKVLRQDPHNSSVLYAGLETGVWVSINGGESWVRMQGNLPTVRVDDILIHSRDREVVIGTHGRGVWIADCAAVEALTTEVVAQDLHLVPPKETVQWIRDGSAGRYGARRFHIAQSTGATISYWLGREPKKDEDVTISIHDATGKQIATVRAKKKAGMNEVTWNLRKRSARGRGPRGGGGRGRRGGRGARGGGTVSPGTYRVTVRFGEEEMSAGLNVVADPKLAPSNGDNRP